MNFEIPVNERFEIQRRAVYLFDQFFCELDLQLAQVFQAAIDLRGHALNSRFNVGDPGGQFDVIPVHFVSARKERVRADSLSRLAGRAAIDEAGTFPVRSLE